LPPIQLVGFWSAIVAQAREDRLNKLELADRLAAKSRRSERDVDPESPRNRSWEHLQPSSLHDLISCSHAEIAYERAG
jgi:hypothetical protein